MTRTLRAAIYNRVSRDKTKRQKSVGQQDVENRGDVKRGGWELDNGDVYTDNDLSASRYSKKERPDWQRLLDRLSTGQIDVLVIWEISRATRDRVVWAALFEICIDKNVRLCVGGKVYDLDDPEDAFNLDLGNILSVRESAVTRKRVQRDMNANAVAGRPHGRVAMGFVRDYDRHSGALIGQSPHPEWAPIVRDIIERIASGASIYSICKDYNSRGITTAKDAVWVASTVRRIAMNPAYVAKRVHRGQIIGDANWPALVDEATFWKANKRLADPSRRTTRTTRLRYLLSGVATCGVCKGKIRVIDNRGICSYACSNRFCVTRKLLPVDDLVRLAIVERLSRPDVADLFATDDEDIDAIESARAEAQELRDRLDSFYDKAAAGAISAAGLARVEKPLLAQIESAEQRSRQVATSSPVVRRLVEAADVGKEWDGLEVADQRDAVRALATVKIMPTAQGQRTFDARAISISFEKKSGAKHLADRR